VDIIISSDAASTRLLYDLLHNSIEDAEYPKSVIIFHVLFRV